MAPRKLLTYTQVRRRVEEICVLGCMSTFRELLEVLSDIWPCIIQMGGTVYNFLGLIWCNGIYEIFQGELCQNVWCCGQLWVRHMICGQTCDELYHFTFYLIVLEYPLDTQKSTKSTLAVKLSVSAIIYPRWTATFGF